MINLYKPDVLSLSATSVKTSTQVSKLSIKKTYKKKLHCMTPMKTQVASLRFFTSVYWEGGSANQMLKGLQQIQHGGPPLVDNVHL